MKKLLFISLLVVSVLLSSVVQGALPFTVLSNNTDTANRKLYVEVMYEKPACQDFQARFKLKTRQGDSVMVKVDSFLNNAGTFTRVAGDSVLQRPLAGGYKLMFDLPSSIAPQDSPYICVVNQAIPYFCEGCGAGGSNTLFTENDIHPDCPYKGDDMVACKRTRKNGQWEGWILDPRDCKPYRIVMMPDGRWWFGQNLNYQKDLSYRTLKEGATSTLGAVGEFWCPSGESAVNNTMSVVSNNRSNDNSAVSPTSCNTYGALYSWTTALALNGRTQSSTAHTNLPQGYPSKSQGICPDGWFIPSDYDWSVMLNAVERSLATNNAGHTGCGTGNFGTALATAALKSTYSCPPHVSKVDSFCATYENPAWTWRRKDYNGKISSPLVLGVDKFGFGLIPAGYREYNGSYYYYLGLIGFYHASTEASASTDYSYYRQIQYNSANVTKTYSNKGIARSIRCVKHGDSIPEPMSQVCPPLFTTSIGATGTSTATIANIPSGYVVDWYDSPTGGTLLKSGGSNYVASVSYSTSHVPRHVYAVYRSLSDGKVGQRTSRIDLYIQYSNGGTSYGITLPAGYYLFAVYGARGGAGGSTTYAGGTYGNGGRVQAYTTITGNTGYQLYVGNIGANGSCGVNGSNNGGAGGYGAGGGGSGYYYASPGSCGGGGGGGFSLVRLTSGSVVLIVAGGGSTQPTSSAWYYGAGTAGGHGGGTTGATGGVKYNGSTGYYTSGGTQSGSTAGNGNWYAGGYLYGARGWNAGTNGNASSFAGGAGGPVYSSNSGHHAGSGGGGGYYGGGGGTSYGLGGGGGSSYTNPSYMTSVSHTQGNRNGAGYIQIYKR